ncbi:hypothetical protein [Salipiger abyssi]|uniref:hypothetical protein n=1 Tax=Salipiger abyssi TaxID=1250539 RepID=UPI001A8C5A04|nr:hypothetical protein [Salipiger abyssi]MBN9890212.1 hypothetical protein [Salipiger abyssi]
MHADTFAATQTNDNPATMELLQRVAGIIQRAGPPDTQPLPAAASFLGRYVVIQASTVAFQDGFLMVFAIFVAALVPTWFMCRARDIGKRS